MSFSFGKKSAGLATAAVIAVGFSSVLLGASPASAALGVCGGGSLLSGGICEQTFGTPGAAVFTPPAQTTQLEVLLVGGGGNGNYAYGGGGGEVKVVGFNSDKSTALDLVVGGAAANSSVTQGTTTATAPAGGSATSGMGPPGASGLNEGSMISVFGGGGGGAGASPANAYDGGAGASVASVAPTGSLFSTDTNCYGGGGAVGEHSGTIGVATCGGGSVVDGTSAVTIVPPTANSGGGGGAMVGSFMNSPNDGASGVVVVRWKASAPVTASFDLMGHGSAIAAETLSPGGTTTRPADPTATGFVFNGWYTNSALTTKANFSDPISSDTTFYASWSASLAFTGTTISPFAIPLGIGALAVGAGLVVLSRRRARKTS